MAQCVVIGSGGRLELQVPQPLVPDNCTMVLLSGTEWLLSQSEQNSPFALDVAAAQTLFVAIASLWAVGWAFKRIASALHIS